MGGLVMKATGIVRKVDNLGRIVLPKEIRRKLQINEGDSIEMYAENNYIILKKYIHNYSIKSKLENIILEIDEFNNKNEKIQKVKKYLESALAELKS